MPVHWSWGKGRGHSLCRNLLGETSPPRAPADPSLTAIIGIDQPQKQTSRIIHAHYRRHRFTCRTWILCLQHRKRVISGRWECGWLFSLPASLECLIVLDRCEPVRSTGVMGSHPTPFPLSSPSLRPLSPVIPFPPLILAKSPRSHVIPFPK